MANKLKDIFNKDENYIKGTIQFKDTSASEEFRKALDVVHKEGRPVKIGGIQAVSMGLKSGTGTFPLENYEPVTDLIVGPSLSEVTLKLVVEGEEIDFPVDRYRIENGVGIQTKASFPFSTIIKFDETTQTAKVSIKTKLEKVPNVEEALHSIILEKEFLKKFFGSNLEKGTGLWETFNHLDGLYKIFEKLKYVEEKFGKEFELASINLDNTQSIKDLIEICLLIRDNKVLRSNAKINDITSKELRLASDDEVIVGRDILMTFIWELEFSLWNEKIILYSINLLNNAIVKSIDDLEDGEIRVVYGEKESHPMYITYKGFIKEEDAKQELNRIVENKDEYTEAKTVEEYVSEGY